jgi:hypothetical protein
MILIRSQMKHLLHQAKSARDHRNCHVSPDNRASGAVDNRQPGTALSGRSGVFPVLRPK